MNNLTNPEDSEFAPDDDHPDRSPPETEANQSSRPRGPQRRGRAGRSARRSLPTRDDLLRSLHSLAQLVAIGILGAAEANAIRGALDSTLRAIDRQPTSAAGRTLPIDRLRELVGTYPGAIDILEPLLGDEIVDQLFDRDDAQDEEPADGSHS